MLPVPHGASRGLSEVRAVDKGKGQLLHILGAGGDGLPASSVVSRKAVAYSMETRTTEDPSHDGGAHRALASSSQSGSLPAAECHSRDGDERRRRVTVARPRHRGEDVCSSQGLLRTAGQRGSRGTTGGFWKARDSSFIRGSDVHGNRGDIRVASSIGSQSRRGDHPSVQQMSVVAPPFG